MHNIDFTDSELIEYNNRLYRNPNLMTLFRYQKQARIYLDEYKEQKKLREEYFRPEANFYNRWLKRN